MIDASRLLAAILAVPLCLCIEWAVQWAIRSTEPKKRP